MKKLMFLPWLKKQLENEDTKEAAEEQIENSMNQSEWAKNQYK